MGQNTIAAVKDVREEVSELDKFAELMQEVGALPQDQQEKVCIYIQGFMAAGISRQKQAG